jgi:hypothetical protein
MSYVTEKAALNKSKKMSFGLLDIGLKQHGLSKHWYVPGSPHSVTA